jgi:hypothetical protein
VGSSALVDRDGTPGTPGMLTTSDLTDPPECSSYFGYVVPCGLGSEQDHGAGFAVAGAIAAALLVIGGSAAGRQDRDRS